ncbi:GDSL esterase/lipase 1 [Vitis vinifera]|uniref:GDSL esterase/lipase 1 n=1 Tax=Vitis vinifera TaxID=29760 RepID=A0A438K6X5_VITVI|nr:GDSL esterase/lipase 1 [Vitis vinifera]
MASFSNFHMIHILLIFSSCLLIPTSSQSHPHQPQNHVAFFIFGDSLLDPGNNNYINTTTEDQANFRPYGETFFKYPTGRFSDGRLIPDFIAEYAKLPLIPPYLQPGNHQFTYGANFASGGAGALDEINQGLVVNLNTQLRYFKKVEKHLRQKLGDEESKKLLLEAVYLISIGGNDYISPLFRNYSVFQIYSHRQYLDMVMGNLTVVIQEIYQKGGRKFGFVNMGPLGCLPAMKAIKLQQGGAGECMEEATVLVKLHNRVLPEVLQKLGSKLKGFKYSIFDFYTTAKERMDNPSKYGFKEAKIACCGSGPYRGLYSCGGMRGTKEYELCSNVSEYMFFDSFHPTDRVYQQLAELVWSGTHNVIKPYNLKQLFGHSQEEIPCDQFEHLPYTSNVP